MSTEAAGAVAADSTAPQLALQLVYLKDCSFEAPLGPRLEAGWNPKVNLDLNTTVSSLNEDVREVLLSITVTAKEGEHTAFIVEVKQAGAFLIRNLPDDDLKRALTSVCPSMLFPYARAAVSNLVTLGGFPQFLLPPVNFDALYARSVADAQNATKN